MKGKVVYFVVPHEKNISNLGISSAVVNNLIILVNDIVIKGHQICQTLNCLGKIRSALPIKKIDMPKELVH